MPKYNSHSCAHFQSVCADCHAGGHIESAGLNRRQVLQGVGGLSLFGALIGESALAQGNAGLIDTHHHFYPPAYQKAWFDWEDKRNIPHFSQQEKWTREGAVADMDKAGVKKAILSMASTPGVWFDLPLAEVNQMVRTVNDYGAQMVKDYPGRFGLFAALTMIDVESTLKEIAYVFDVLKADGVGIQTNYGDKWPGHPDFAPIFQELNRRKALVYFHPLAANCCARLNTGTYPAVIEVPHDTTRAVVNLLLSGSFVKFRDVRWLFSHGGGTIPMLAGRINFFHRNAKNIADIAPQGIEAELKRLYYDTANATHPSSMASLLKLVPSSQVVYGSDYPYVPMDTQANTLTELGLEKNVLQQIQYLNANNLLKHPTRN
jgi:predicted TIM-barrel fold metal-dependent hydrolase